MSNEKIGKELYWRFAKFEDLFKDNLLKVLYMISPSFLNLVNDGVPLDFYDYNKEQKNSSNSHQNRREIGGNY
jgi:hypothetical protein